MCAKCRDMKEKKAVYGTVFYKKEHWTAHMHCKACFRKILPNSRKHGVLNIEDGSNTVLR